MTVATKKRKPADEGGAVFDRDLDDLPQEMRPVARLLPDRDLPAANLVALGRAVQAAGAARVVIVTERGLE